MPSPTDKHLFNQWVFTFLVFPLLLLAPLSPPFALGQDAITADSTMNTQVSFDNANYTIGGGDIFG